MSFLAPLFALGALAIAAPVIFHLIRRTTREQTPFSSLMFLQPTPPRVTRRSRLDNIFLLLLRCLVICLLALGFARPFFKRPSAPPPDAQGSTKVIVLVDASASMRRENLWNEAVSRAESILRKLNPADQAAVFAFDQAARPVVNFSQWAGLGIEERVALAVNRLRETKPTWAGTSLGNALTSAAEAFEDADKREDSAGVRRIVLISDLQEGSKVEGLQGYEWPRGLEVVVESLKPRRVTNAGLQLISGGDEAAGESAAALRVRVSNSTDASREQFQVRRANGSSLAELYVPPGQSRILMLTNAVADAERLVVQGDEADFDNTLHIIPPKAEHVRVLFLGADSETNPQQGLYYLKRALQQTPRQNVEILARGPGDPINPADLVDVQLTIVSDALPENRIQLVRQLLGEGKTVVLAVQTLAGANALAALTGLPSLAAEEAKVGNYAMLGQIDFQHPLFAPFADPRFSDFTKIHFWKHRRVDAGQLPGARVLARFDNREGDPAILQVPVGKGSVFAFTFGWQPADSQFALSSKFVPLLYSLLEQSGALRSQAAQFLIGDPVDLASLQTGQPLVVRKPDGAEVSVPPGQRFTQTDMPGIFTVASQPPGRFAVNLPAEESKTAPMPVENLQKLGVPLKVEAAVTAKQAQQAARVREQLRAAELEGRQKLWRWLIVAALVVLMVETWLAGRLTRRAALQTEAPL